MPLDQVPGLMFGPPIHCRFRTTTILTTEIVSANQFLKMATPTRAKQPEVHLVLLKVSHDGMKRITSNLLRNVFKPKADHSII